MRRRLKMAYFDQRLGDIEGDLRATWEVLGEVIRGRRGKGRGGLAGILTKGELGSQMGLR